MDGLCLCQYRSGRVTALELQLVLNHYALIIISKYEVVFLRACLEPVQFLRKLVCSYGF
jgi:hypothetical protein